MGHAYCFCPFSEQAVDVRFQTDLRFSTSGSIQSLCFAQNGCTDTVDVATTCFGSGKLSLHSVSIIGICGTPVSMSGPGRPGRGQKIESTAPGRLHFSYLHIGRLTGGLGVYFNLWNLHILVSTVCPFSLHVSFAVSRIPPTVKREGGSILVSLGRHQLKGYTVSVLRSE